MKDEDVDTLGSLRQSVWTRGSRPLGRPPGSRGAERGAALVLAILVLAILTVIGIALMLVTSTESRIAANEWSINRAFYASDAGIRWAAVEMTNPTPFMTRPEFTTPTAPYNNSPFGTVLFQLPSWKHGGGGFFTGDVLVGGQPADIQVRVQTPSLLGRGFYPGGRMNEGSAGTQYLYAYEVRTTGGDNFQQYSRALEADIEMGPLPNRLPF